MTSSNIWITESNTTNQTIAVVAMTVLGLALAIGFRHFDSSGLTDSLAGFLLGVLLLVVGLGGLLFGGKQVITIDTKKRLIIIEGKNRFGTKSSKIRFNDIKEVSVGELGDNEGGSISYHLVIQLKTGKEMRLFYGFFDGQYDKSVSEARCRRLIQCLQTTI
jgi:hypothetical protein